MGFPKCRVLFSPWVLSAQSGAGRGFGGELGLRAPTGREEPSSVLACCIYSFNKSLLNIYRLWLGILP